MSKQKRDAQLNELHLDRPGRGRLHCDDKLLVLCLPQLSAAEHQRGEEVLLWVGAIHTGARERNGRSAYHIDLVDGHPRRLAILRDRVGLSYDSYWFTVFSILICGIQ